MLHSFMKKIPFILLLFSFCMAAPDIVQTKENDKIDLIYLKNGCTNCHGFYGQGTSSGPRLQNKREKYLLRRLRDLQRGIYTTPGGTIMLPFARSLDENQTRAMAHYLSHIKTSHENWDKYDYDSDDFGDS